VTGLPIEGPARPPRDNGELVFGAPWERDLFGLTMAILDKRFFTWDEFQGRLVEAIGRCEMSGAPFRYYACWAEALEGLLLDKQLLDAATLADATRDQAALFTHAPRL
jgi:nitrile hydratase accessory protein